MDYPKTISLCQTKRNEILAGMNTTEFAVFVEANALTLSAARLRQALRRDAEKPLVLLCDNDRQLLVQACHKAPVKGRAYKDIVGLIQFSPMPPSWSTYRYRWGCMLDTEVYRCYDFIRRMTCIKPSCAELLRTALVKKKSKLQLRTNWLDAFRKKTKTWCQKPCPKRGCRATDVSSRSRR